VLRGLQRERPDPQLFVAACGGEPLHLAVLGGRVGVRAQHVEIDCDGQSLTGGIALAARREKSRRGRCVRRERIRRAGAELEHIRKLALSLRRPARIPCTPA